MSRPRLFIGGLACFVALVVAVSALAATAQNRRDSETARVEYTVASASNTATVAPGPLVAGRVAVPAHGGARLPEPLALLVVGSMLIGLAAAVRRTT